MRSLPAPKWQQKPPVPAVVPLCYDAEWMAMQKAGQNCGTDCGTVMKIKWPGWSEMKWVILSRSESAIMPWKVNHEKLGATAGRCRIYFLFISAWPWRTMKHIKPIPLAYPWCQGSTASVGWLFGCPCSVAFWHADQGFLCEPKQVEPFPWLGQGLFHEKGDAGE